MDLLVIDTTNRRQVQQFLEMPFRLYRDIPQWVPPLASDARQMLNRSAHPFYRHSEAAFFLALDSTGKAVGRLGVLDNHNYNTFNHSSTAFFYLFECEDDPLAVQTLITSACEWARARGLAEIIGPKGFTVFDGLGLLTRGFELRPAFGLPYNPAYYVNLVEANRLEPCTELVSGYIRRQDYRLPEKVLQVADLVMRRRGLKVERYHSRCELRALVPHLKDLYNSALTGTVGNVPLTDSEVQTLANQLLWFADPELIKIITKDGQPIGFLFAYLDISAALQRTRGRLCPFGWLDLLLELRRTDWININGAGIIEKYRGLVGTAVLFKDLYATFAESRFNHAEVVQIGVENANMQREMRDLGVDFNKVHRVYRRTL